MPHTPVSQEIGAPIPNNTPHAVSVTLPTWEANVGYEEGQDWVVNKMNSGYPRFFIHKSIQYLCELLELNYGKEGEKAMVFPTYNVAKRCRTFIKSKTLLDRCNVRILQLSTPSPKTKEEESIRVGIDFSVVFYPGSEFRLLKSYWQHTGEGISSRRADYILSELKTKLLEDAEVKAKEIQEKLRSKIRNPKRGSSSMNRSSSSTSQNLEKEYSTYIEERFGRNLDLKFAKEAKSILEKRIMNKINESNDYFTDCDNVYLLPTGITSLFTAHQAILNMFPERAETEQSICFGFPYVDTLNILKKWGAGVQFYGFGDDESIQELEAKLESGEKFLSLFCECPSNPLLKTPNLIKLKQLADKYGFLIVIDDTVGNFSNINVLPYADMVATSLTKVFSGDSNVMGGSLVINPHSNYYKTLKSVVDENFEPELYWGEDAIYLERNSRDFTQRSQKVNFNTAKILEIFQSSPLIDKIFYPSLLESKKYYDELKTPTGGYGGLFSLQFKDEADARCFFNEVKLSKGPSLGTNFTLVSPYLILLHFAELDEIEKWGVDRNLIRISVGLEDIDELSAIVKKGMSLAEQQHEALHS